MTKRLLYQSNGFFHRLVGARGTTAMTVPDGSETVPGSSRPCMAANQEQRQHGLVHGYNNNNNKNNKPSNFGHVFQNAAAVQEIAQHRLVFFGEIHSRPPIVSFQQMVQAAMAAAPAPELSNDHDDKHSITTSVASSTRKKRGTLHVVLEHFSFDMQDLLDQYQQGNMSFDELVTHYKNIGTENHNLEPYRKLFEEAKALYQNHHDTTTTTRRVQLHAGFLSRTYARQLLREGQEITLQRAACWLPVNPQLQGTEQHYNIFESLLTGRRLGTDQPPTDTFRTIFQAQVLKDVAMAHKINTLLDHHIDDHDNNHDNDDKILVLVGNGHVLGYSGVPERVLQQHPELFQETCVVASHHGTDLEVDMTQNDNEIHEIDLNQAILRHLNHAWGPANIADYVYVYQEQDDQDQQQQHGDQPLTADRVMKETKKVYDKVGETAHIPGNATKAMAIMKAMGYSDHQIAIAGSDIHNFQGVGNPHIHANLQPGETVLDVGSGLGIDSFLAREAVGDTGFVLGIDVSNREVSHAKLCAQRRNLSQIRFTEADMEHIPLPDQSVDVVISNGAFCLAPEKEKAFREIFRVLKPGGRISICTTTTRDKTKLEPGVSWPLCMQMFIPQNDIQPLCERIGYVDVVVDDSDSSMSLELPMEVLELDENQNPNNAQQNRNKVHVGSAEFSHLENYDMDALCARVCVVAKKPDHATKL